MFSLARHFSRRPTWCLCRSTSHCERLASEDFSAVPHDVFDGRKGRSAAGSQWSTVEVVHAFRSFRSRGVDGGDEDPILLIQTERATVKQFVVQGT